MNANEISHTACKEFKTPVHHDLDSRSVFVRKRRSVPVNTHKNLREKRESLLQREL